MAGVLVNASTLHFSDRVPLVRGFILSKLNRFVSCSPDACVQAQSSHTLSAQESEVVGPLFCSATAVNNV